MEKKKHSNIENFPTNAIFLSLKLTKVLTNKFGNTGSLVQIAVLKIFHEVYKNLCNSDTFA